MLADLRRALRTLRREPGFVLAAVVTLSLGIGANSAMFGVVDALVFSPPPAVGDAGSLLRLETVPDPAAGEHSFFIAGFSRGDLAAFSGTSSPFAEAAAYGDRQLTVGDASSVHKSPALFVSGNYFRTLRTPVALGRPLLPGDDAPGATPVAVVSDAFWRRSLGADRAAVGRTLRVGGRDVVIAGVAVPGFVGMDVGAPDLWLPIAAAATLGEQIGPEDRQLSIVGRLRAGLTRQGATAAAAAILRARDAAAPSRGSMTGRRLVELTGAAHRIGAHRSNPVPVWLLAATLAVLLVACANVASLTLARAERRRRDAAVRVSLGAGPWRLARQAFAESALLAAAGALGGTLVAAWSTRLVDALSLPPLPPLLGPRVVAVTAALALVSMVLAGIGPALTSARAEPASTLGGGAGRTSARGSRAQTALTAAQIALTLTLLVTAGLFVRSLRNARFADVGFDLEHTLVVSVDLSPSRFDESASDALLREAERRLAGLPGARSVSLAAFAPFGGLLIVQPSVPGSPPPADAMTPGNMVGAEYFHTIGATLRRGRTFTAAEADAGAPVVVLNERAAHAFFPAGDALGRCLSLMSVQCNRVVGIVRDMRTSSLTGDDGPFLYVPMSRRSAAHGGAELFVRTSGDPSALVALAHAAVQSIDPALPYVSVSTQVDLIRPRLAAWQVAAVAFTVFGVAALVLASVGLYAVIAYRVAQRTREVGIRMALGAVQRDVVRLVVAQGARVAALGVVVGIGASVAVAMALRSKLYGVSTVDPATYAAVAALLAACALLASWLPARRAARVDPAIALRAE